MIKGIIFFIIGAFITLALDEPYAIAFIGGLVSAVLAVCIDMRNKVKNLEVENKNTAKSDDGQVRMV